MENDQEQVELLDIHQIAMLRGLPVKGQSLGQAASVTRRWLKRRFCEPSEQEVRMCHDGKARLVYVWLSDDVANEIDRDVPRGLAAAGSEVARRVQAMRGSTQDE